MTRDDNKAYKELEKYINTKDKRNPFWTFKWNYANRRRVRVFTTLGAFCGFVLYALLAAGIIYLAMVL
ncbi:MAG: hypothetical protein GY906_12840 [bacterium]|nr:hypothetical protein [bacterium]